MLFVLILLAAVIEGAYIFNPEWFAFLSGGGKEGGAVVDQERVATPKTVSEETSFYSISATHPSQTPVADATANAKAVEIMETFIENEIARFKDNGQFDSLTAEDVEMMGYNAGRTQLLQISYEEYRSEATASYVFTIYQDTLGAHGNTFFRTFTFDTRTGDGLVLADLFAPGTNYLDTLTAISRETLYETLKETSEPQYIDQGTTAYEDNFQNWYLTSDALVILFPPYQVAPYAEGPQKVAIPFDSLESILK